MVEYYDKERMKVKAYWVLYGKNIYELEEKIYENKNRSYKMDLTSV